MSDATIIDPPVNETPPADPPANDPPANEPPANDPPADPPSDWRANLAGEDAELLKFLGRYHSQDAALKAWKKTNDEIKSGKYRKPLSDDPTDEELAAYRKDFGVPEKPDGYLENLDGLVVGDDDKPIVGQFADAMHKVNAPDSVVKAGIKWYYDLVAEQDAAAAEANKAAKQQNDDLLREEWGGEYRANINAVKAFAGGLPEGVRAALDGYGPDGVALLNNAEVIKWLAGMALEANPAVTVVPGAGSNQAAAIQDEIDKIEKMMREDRASYNRDEKVQARYRELLTAREKLPK